MPEASNFQSIIMNLQNFWAKQGCLIWQPYYSQVGAGTYNPATFLRVLGPEPWNVAYVEPSVRPDDGRYGENPNRLQQHYQFQVILKPDPGNPQEIYLKSLEAIGIDPHRHDIRFVEDNWESPALGAWGLGWEVWLDGQEITQFTYFQQCGGQVLDPVSVEITYGLERIAMPLQRVRNFREIRWTNDRTYGDVNLQGEQEHSKYYFENADIERMQKLYALYIEEANSALEKGLILPAYDYILKCSQTFNILDTRGAVGVTERQALFGRMRDLSRRVSEAYIAERERLKFPWLKEGATGEKQKIVAQGKVTTGQSTNKADMNDFLLEIGTEELPVGDIDAAVKALNVFFKQMILDVYKFKYSNIKIYGTPRRLVIHVAEMKSTTEPSLTDIKGPPLKVGIDSNGKPTQALIGWAKKIGVTVEDALNRRVVGADGSSHFGFSKSEPGQPVIDLLSKVLPTTFTYIKFDKSMRWNSSNTAFSRPIRWLLALYGDTVVPFSFAGLNSGNITRGLRTRQPEEFIVKNSTDYFKALEKQGIVLDEGKRKDAIAEQVKKVVVKAGGEAVISESILAEVAHLVEAPRALLGSFDPAFLRLPDDVLVSVMEKHQRYFTLRKPDGKLLPNFVVVRNGDGEHEEVVADGNQQVITARFADADFFIKQDLQHKLEDFLPKLATLTFQVKLGSMLDKSRRIERLVSELVEPLGMDEKEKETSLRSAMLCKADLVSKMVVEMTSLQGIMGKYYALHSGENEAVAQAIYEHYLPRFSCDESPHTKAALAISIADRLDTLAGLFGVDLAPSGTKDPFAQRRAALGLVQELIDWDLDFEVQRGLFMAATGLAMLAGDESLLACKEFITGRLQNTLLDQGYKFDVVAAVLKEQGGNPARALRAVKELTEWVERPDWRDILPAFARIVRITRDQPERHPFNEKLLYEPAELELNKAFSEMEKRSRKPGSANDLLKTFLPIIGVVNEFFDKVLVMAEDRQVRANRLGLLQRIAALAEGVADFSQLEGF